jgi:peroxiredoxin
MSCSGKNWHSSPGASAVKSNFMLKEGDKAPEIKAQTDSGESFQLSKLKGRQVVLYFFPRADTPG